MADLNYRLIALFKMTVPALVTLTLVLLSTVDLHISGIERFVPLIAMISIFYWCIYWPSLLPAWFVFLLGIFQDFLYGTPLGISSLINLLLFWLVVSQRKYLIKETFWVVWAVFSFILLIFVLISSVVYSIYYEQFAISNDILMQWMVSVLVYPFLHKLFNVIHVSFLKV